MILENTETILNKTASQTRIVPMDHSEEFETANTIVGEKRKRFWDMLVTYVAKTGYQSVQGRQTQILSVGCGNCEEGIVLSAYFGGESFGNPSGQVKLTGIDVNKKAIEEAIIGHGSLDFSGPIAKRVLPPNFEFIHGDATNLGRYPNIPNQIDIIVIRHQQISSNEEIWTKIFQEALHRLRPDGIMILTSFSDVEHRILIDRLRDLDCEILVDEENIHAKQTELKGVSIDKRCVVDRNIAIIKRKNKNGQI